MKSNKRMDALLSELNGLSDTLPDTLTVYANSTIITAQGCFVLDVCYKASRRGVKLSSSLDETGYECLVNHIHLDEHATGAGDRLRLAILLMRKIKDKWIKSQYTQMPIQFIISINDTCCVFRFHVIRPGQVWMDSDLEAYKEDAVLTTNLSDDDQLLPK